MQFYVIEYYYFLRKIKAITTLYWIGIGLYIRNILDLLQIISKNFE